MPITLAAPLTPTIGTSTALGLGSDNKLVSSATATLGTSLRYRLEFQNNGSYPYDSLTVVDNIPAQLQVTSIRAGQQSAGSQPFGGSIPLTIEYQTNLNATWRSLTGSPFATNIVTDVAVSTLGLGGGEAITALRYTYTNVPVGFVLTGSTTASGYLATLLSTDRNGNPVTVGQQVVNAATYTAARSGFASLVRNRSATVTVIEGATLPRPSVSKLVISASVQAIRFDFGDITLAPQQSFTFTFSLQAPIGAPTAGEIAWNSYGYRGEVVGSGTRLLPSEPVKVGIAVQAPEPPEYGNRAWLDTDEHGVQDDGEPGFNGVRVELYRDNGDGVSDPGSEHLCRLPTHGRRRQRPGRQRGHQSQRHHCHLG